MILCPIHTTAAHISDTAANNLTLVKRISEPIGNAEIMQAILMQESAGGLHTKSSTGSYGLMQVQITAARSVLQRVPELMASAFPGQLIKTLSNDVIKKKLINDDEFNVTIAANHFKIYLALCNYNMNKAIASYRYGIGGVQRFTAYDDIPYVKQVRSKLMVIVQPFNRLSAEEPTIK